MPGTKIKVGTSGFSFPDWRGTVYPKKLQPRDALGYYDEELGFDCVEINSTYYTLVSEKSFAGMDRKTRPDFEFVVKGFKGITHDPFDKRLGEKRPSPSEGLEDAERFLHSLRPIIEKNKLSAILLQFPSFFYPTDGSKKYILSCKKRFGNVPVVIEFRNTAWAKNEYFDFLKENELAYCTVDEPPLKMLMPFINKVTSKIAYLRFHGRNPNWFNAPASERYNYLYSKDELSSFIPELRKMERLADKVFVMFNNCHQGAAMKNAMMMRDMMGIPIHKSTLF